VKLLLLEDQGHGYLITVAEELKVSKQMVLLPPQLRPCLFLCLCTSGSLTGWQAISWFAPFPVSFFLKVGSKSYAEGVSPVPCAKAVS